MEKKKWKLGADMFSTDDILDPITFDDVILAVKCNCKEITPEAVMRTYREILEIALEDADFIVENNVEEIAEAARKMRNGNDD